MDRFIIEIPHNAYLRCLAKHKQCSAEYRLFSNGIVLHRNSEEAVVHLRCDAHNALLIQSIVFRVCPEFLDRVHYYPDRAQNF